VDFENVGRIAKNKRTQISCGFRGVSLENYLFRRKIASLKSGFYLLMMNLNKKYPYK
jgi:hypothetical protein